MDEISYQLSYSQNELVVFDRCAGAPLSLVSGSTGWCSVLESISAIGDSMKPLVIHRGTAPDKPLDRWFPPSSECPHWRWGFTEKGWTNNEHAIELEIQMTLLIGAYSSLTVMEVTPRVSLCVKS